MKKKIIIILTTGLFLFSVYFFVPGFTKNSTAYIGEYTISEDGTEIIIEIGVASSIGYIRKVAVKQQESGKMYLVCYNAFGGINGSIGAKAVYTLPLNEDTTMIAIYRNSNAYEEILTKDSDGVWQRAQ